MPRNEARDVTAELTVVVLLLIIAAAAVVDLAF